MDIEELSEALKSKTMDDEVALVPTITNSLRPGTWAWVSTTWAAFGEHGP